jgi:hypothetical protein
MYLFIIINTDSVIQKLIHIRICMEITFKHLFIQQKQVIVAKLKSTIFTNCHDFHKTDNYR